MFSLINNFVNHHSLIPEHSTIIVGLSGGPDSVFLLHYVASLRKTKKITLIAAHLDHEWRKDSAQDVQFCAKIAQELDVKFVCGKISDLSLSVKFNGSKEELGRVARRNFLENVARQENADRIALAHHAQDQQETFFIRLVRGTTLTGLCSMRPQQGMYIRPLLETNKQDILDYLQKQNIEYLIDPTNESTVFLRNRIRASVIPAVHECDERFDKNFVLTLYSLQETEDFLSQLTAHEFAQVAELQGINLKKLFTRDVFIQKRILVYWLTQEKISFTLTAHFIDEIMRFLAHERGGTHQLGSEWAMQKKQWYAKIIQN